MSEHDQSFDMLAERGQYRAFQRAYGKENQMMLGLIILTVAWSYAAHVYGHAVVFAGFVRYGFVATGIYGLYTGLLYAHRILEKAVAHYRNWEREQNNTLREERAKEKSKERRKRARVNETKADQSQAAAKEDAKEEAAHQQAGIDAKARKQAAEKEQLLMAREEVERRKQAQEKAGAAARKAQQEAKQKQKARLSAEATLVKMASAPDAPTTKKTSPVKAPAEALQLPFPKPAPVPRVTTTAEVDAQTGGHWNKLDNIASAAVGSDIRRAEHAVAFAKQEAERAQKQLALAQEVADRTRVLKTKGNAKGNPAAASVNLPAPAPAPVSAPATSPATATGGHKAKGKPANAVNLPVPAPATATATPPSERRRSSQDQRDSLKELLRPAGLPGGGGGYIPPHLRDGYAPKPTKERLPPRWEVGSERQQRASVGERGQGRKKVYPAPNRPLPRHASVGSVPSPSSDENRSPLTSSPPSAHSEVEDGAATRKVQKGKASKKSDSGFESKNAFASLVAEEDEEEE